MKFGIHNPSWLFGPDPAEAFEAVKAKAQWAENHGFVWLSVMDHLIQIGGVGAPDEPFMEGWTVLSALAAVTSRIRLATLATSVGYRNPAHLAKIAAGVDLISRGRLTLGIGAGYLEAEYRQYGWEFPARPAVRIRQMEEAVRLILAMWTEKQTTFHGRYFNVEDAIGRHAAFRMSGQTPRNGSSKGGRQSSGSGARLVSSVSLVRDHISTPGRESPPPGR